jgi:hypothetical protein
MLLSIWSLERLPNVGVSKKRIPKEETVVEREALLSTSVFRKSHDSFEGGNDENKIFVILNSGYNKRHIKISGREWKF